MLPVVIPQRGIVYSIILLILLTQTDCSAVILSFHRKITLASYGLPYERVGFDSSQCSKIINYYIKSLDHKSNWSSLVEHKMTSHKSKD